jgi:hypothetical protein
MFECDQFSYFKSDNVPELLKSEAFINALYSDHPDDRLDSISEFVSEIGMEAINPFWTEFQKELEVSN